MSHHCSWFHLSPIYSVTALRSACYSRPSRCQSLVPILLRVIPTLQLNSSSRHHSDIDDTWSDCVVVLFLQKRFSESSSVFIVWHYFDSVSSKCAGRDISVIFLFILLKFPSSLSVQFYSFFWSACLIWSDLSENSGINFAMYCIALTNDFTSLHDFGGFNCNIAFNFSLFGFVPCTFVLCSSQKISLRKNSDFFSFALYLASWSFPSNLDIFRGVYFCSPLLPWLHRPATRLFDSSMFCLFSLEISSV